MENRQPLFTAKPANLRLIAMNCGAILCLIFILYVYKINKISDLAEAFIICLAVCYWGLIIYCRISIYSDSIEIYYPFRLLWRKYVFAKEDIDKMSFNRVFSGGGRSFFITFKKEQKNKSKRDGFYFLYSNKQLEEIVKKLNENGIQAYSFP
jgi:hypothetical protein